MGWVIFFLILALILWFFRGIWRVIFKPIFDWIGEMLQNAFMRHGMSRTGARALISIAIIIVIILIAMGI